MRLKPPPPNNVNRRVPALAKQDDGGQQVFMCLLWFMYVVMLAWQRVTRCLSGWCVAGEHQTSALLSGHSKPSKQLQRVPAGHASTLGKAAKRYPSKKKKKEVVDLQRPSTIVAGWRMRLRLIRTRAAGWNSLLCDKDKTCATSTGFFLGCSSGIWAS